MGPNVIGLLNSRSTHLQCTRKATLGSLLLVLGVVRDQTCTEQGPKVIWLSFLERVVLHRVARAL